MERKKRIIEAMKRLSKPATVKDIREELGYPDDLYR